MGYFHFLAFRVLEIKLKIEEGTWKLYYQNENRISDSNHFDEAFIREEIVPPYDRNSHAHQHAPANAIRTLAY